MSNKRKAKASEAAAVEDLKKKLRIARQKGDFKEVAELHNQLGNQHRLLGNLEEALEHHKEEVNTCKAYNKNDKIGLAIAYRNIGEVLTEMKKETDAIKYIRMYLKLSTEVSNFVERQRAQITLGRAYLSMADRDDEIEDMSNTNALQHAENSFRLAYSLLKDDQLLGQLSNNEKELMLMKANNCQNLGITLEIRGKMSEAAAWIQRAIDISCKYQFHECLAPCYAIICSIQLKSAKYDKALESAKNATKAAKAAGSLELEIESIILEAKALFTMDEVDTGKRILKKLRERIRKKDTLHRYLEEVETFLTAAVRICRTQDAMFATTGDDINDLLKCHEKLGDNYTTLMNYGAAITHYKKCCELSDKLGNQRKLSRFYFSIAESYRDLQNYEGALKYYQLEMSVNLGNPVEEFKTQTNVTFTLEKLNKPQKEIIEAHEFAIDLAVITNHMNKIVTARTNFGMYLKSIGNKEDSEKQLELAKTASGGRNFDMEGEEPNSEDFLNDEDDKSDVDLNNLSGEDSSDDETEESNVTGRRKRTTARVNEAGESQLHLAAKRGDLKTVRRLIRQNHSVMAKDNAGWTPLHEACNFGHIEVAEELIKHGAKVNDSGGVLSDKITPLHDAACNCHCEVIKLLLKHGANVLAKDSEGRYPLDSLINWKESEDGQACSEQDLISYKEVRDLLMQRMKEAGKPYRPEDEKKAKRRSSTRNRSPPTRSLLVTKERDYECPIPVKIATDDFDPDQEGDGTKLYKNAMKQVGRKDCDGPSSKRVGRSISPGPRGALIPAELDVHEDWMLPDGVVTTATKSKSNNAKRKRDPKEDTCTADRVTRRRTLDDTEKPSTSTRRRRLSCESNPSVNSEESNSRNDDYDMHFGAHNTLDNQSESLHDEPIFNDDDDFEAALLQEDFLPTQIPAQSSVEFGTTVDVVDDSMSESESPCPSPRRSRTSLSHRSRRANLSSDEDIIDSNISKSRSTKNMKLSDIANALKNPRSKKQRNDKTVQSKLSFTVTKRTRNNSMNRDSMSPEVEIERVLPNYATDASSKVTLRLNVKVLDNPLLVPVESCQMRENIDWLATDVAIRYLRLFGVKPNLRLQTKEGANLSGSDSISLALGPNDRDLIGIVDSFDLPPLVERYSTSCEEASYEMDLEVKSILNAAESSNVLNLNDVNLRGKAAVVLMNALQRQYTLTVLWLSGCSLYDIGISVLCKAISTLPGLIDLDISNNGITKIGFACLTKVFQTNTGSPSYVKPPCLNSLILSNNPLGNFVGQDLAKLMTALTSLTRLEISDCGFSEKLFIWSKNDLPRAFSTSRLEELDISYNNWNGSGIEKCLRSLPAQRMRILNCSACGVTNDNSEDIVAKAISGFLSKNEDCCNLKCLKLNDACLSDKSIDMILDSFDRLVRLESLELTRNDITSASLVSILEQTTEKNIPLTKLDISSVPTLWNTRRTTEEHVLNAIEKKMNSEKRIAYLRLPRQLPTDEDMTKLESKIVELLNDYAGNTTFTHENVRASIIYRFDD